MKILTINLPLLIHLLSLAVCFIVLILSKINFPLNLALSSASSLTFIEYYFLLAALPHILVSLFIFLRNYKKVRPAERKVFLYLVPVLLVIGFAPAGFVELIFILLISYHLSGQAIGILRLWGVDYIFSNFLRWVTFLIYKNFLNNSSMSRKNNHFLLLVLGSVVLSLLIYKIAGTFQLIRLITLFQVSHYYVETIIWKSGSIYRNYIYTS